MLDRGLQGGDFDIHWLSVTARGDFHAARWPRTLTAAVISPAGHGTLERPSWPPTEASPAPPHAIGQELRLQLLLKLDTRVIALSFDSYRVYLGLTPLPSKLQLDERSPGVARVGIGSDWHRILYEDAEHAVAIEIDGVAYRIRVGSRAWSAPRSGHDPIAVKVGDQVTDQRLGALEVMKARCPSSRRRRTGVRDPGALQRSGRCSAGALRRRRGGGRGGRPGEQRLDLSSLQTVTLQTCSGISPDPEQLEEDWRVRPAVISSGPSRRAALRHAGLRLRPPDPASAPVRPGHLAAPAASLTPRTGPAWGRCCAPSWTPSPLQAPSPWDRIGLRCRCAPPSTSTSATPRAQGGTLPRPLPAERAELLRPGVSGGRRADGEPAPGDGSRPRGRPRPAAPQAHLSAVKLVMKIHEAGVSRPAWLRAGAGPGRLQLLGRRRWPFITDNAWQTRYVLYHKQRYEHRSHQLDAWVAETLGTRLLMLSSESCIESLVCSPQSLFRILLERCAPEDEHRPRCRDHPSPPLREGRAGGHGHRAALCQLARTTGGRSQLDRLGSRGDADRAGAGERADLHRGRGSHRTPGAGRSEALRAQLVDWLSQVRLGDWLSGSV